MGIIKKTKKNFSSETKPGLNPQKKGKRSVFSDSDTKSKNFNNETNISFKKKNPDHSYFSARYIFAILLSVFEVLTVISIVVALCYFVPFFYISALIISVGCILKIIASDDNPEYKIPWVLLVLVIPIAGFMLYIMFYSRKLQPKFIKRLRLLNEMGYKRCDIVEFESLKKDDRIAASQAKMLCRIADTHLFTNTSQMYFPLGQDMQKKLIEDLQKAENFIYMEYFIIKEGKFWNSILEILKQKAKKGVDVKVLYDDIGCMSTLPGNYHKQLGKYGIHARPFSRLRGNADSEVNNRSHRKITVIDGKIGYTGGINLADEYINEIIRAGHWKDTGIRLEGEAVWEFTKLFLTDFGISSKTVPQIRDDFYPHCDIKENGFIIPFGDGPRPIYNRNVGKSVIQNILGSASEYVYMTSPYLIIDNDLCVSIENAALRGVDVRIIMPHIPDKKLIFTMTKSFYPRLMSAGVKIYDYTPGFIHAKCYIADGKYAMIGTINLDYRSLVHHFENGVWLYKCDCIADIKYDIDKTLTECNQITPEMLKTRGLTRIVCAVVRIFAPLL